MHLSPIQKTERQKAGPFGRIEVVDLSGKKIGWEAQFIAGMVRPAELVMSKEETFCLN